MRWDCFTFLYKSRSSLIFQHLVLGLAAGFRICSSSSFSPFSDLLSQRHINGRCPGLRTDCLADLSDGPGLGPASTQVLSQHGHIDFVELYYQFTLHTIWTMLYFFPPPPFRECFMSLPPPPLENALCHSPLPLWSFPHQLLSALRRCSETASATQTKMLLLVVGMVGTAAPGHVAALAYPTAAPHASV
jgi:hypothetical protein